MASWINHHPDVPQGFRREACFTLEYSRDRMVHALSQMSDQDIWWRPYEQANAAGNIVLHACGNMTQWIINGCAGRPDTRDRPAEFARRDPLPGSQLIDQLGDTVAQAVAVVMAMDDAQLLRPRFVQLAEVTGLGAIFHSVAHLEGHAQEVIYIARLRLGERYRFKDVY